MKRLHITIIAALAAGLAAFPASFFASRIMTSFSNAFGDIMNPGTVANMPTNPAHALLK